MTSDHLISIITPTFNHERYIGECLESVRAQTFPQWHQVVIDDGSDDGTGRIVRAFHDAKIEYFYQQHRGVRYLGETYNTALDFARGDLVAILEGDDYWPVDKIERQIAYFDDPNVILTYGVCRVIAENGRTLYDLELPSDRSIRDNEPVGSAMRAFVRPSNILGASTVMIRKSALLTIGGFFHPPLLPLVDFPTWVRLAVEGAFRGIPHLLGFWRRHAKSVNFDSHLEIWSGCAKYANQFVEVNCDRIQSLGIDLDLAKIRVRQNEFLRVRERFGPITDIRFYLDLGEFSRAREAALASFRSWRDPLVFFASLIGFLSASIHFNLLAQLSHLRDWLGYEMVSKDAHR